MDFLCQNLTLYRTTKFYTGRNLTYYQTTSFRLFQTERVCRQQFQIRRKWQKVIQMGRKQFVLFPQCFQKACFPGVSKGVIVWEWVKALSFANNKFYLTQMMGFGSEKVENVMGKTKHWLPEFLHFSSTDRKPAGLLSCLSVRRACTCLSICLFVNFSFKYLLRNY